MSKIPLIVIFLFLSGCVRGFNYTQVPVSQVLSDQPQVIYVQVRVEDNYESDMSSVIQEVKMIEGVKEVKYVQSEEADYMTFWIPITFGYDGESPRVASIYSHREASVSDIGWEVNKKWAELFPKTFLIHGAMIELCNDTVEEFVSVSSQEAVFDGWPSSFMRARLSPGKCTKAMIILKLNTPFMRQDVERTKFNVFLRSADKYKK
ncbi:hypothetical protein [Pseudomonas sp. AM4(2022)]|uniref:hypothetical protein n=1 Tax=Pseudomonas sp. AM4(2022) TaxID=2983408 RepID=UPI002E813E6A|nr:hypothetical protein [Pseudomonas sp. AM4(2022)]